MADVYPKINVVSAAETGVNISEVSAGVYAQLINADETVAQSIILDTKGLSLVEILAAATASTTFHLDVSNDNNVWINDYMRWANVTSVNEVLFSAFRYFRLRSDAVATTGAKVTLVLCAKP